MVSTFFHVLMDQERYVAPRLLRHRQPETEGDAARCDPDAQGQLLLSTAGGDFDADSLVPRIEREATGEKNDPFSISGDFGLPSSRGTSRSAVNSTGAIDPNPSGVYRGQSTEEDKFVQFAGEQH